MDESIIESELVLIKLFFKLKGINIIKVINQNLHIKKMLKLNLKNYPSKYPSIFGIDLHIDDSHGVAIEAEQYKFEALIIDPKDKHWATKILNFVSEYKL